MVLANFYQQFIRPAADDSGVVAVLGKDQLELEDLMSPHAAELLHTFSVLANRSVLHPLDDRRLENFIIAAHDEGAKFDATMLKRWLCEEEKWPEEAVSTLAARYEDGRSLLKIYDESHSA